MIDMKFKDFKDFSKDVATLRQIEWWYSRQRALRAHFMTKV